MHDERHLKFLPIIATGTLFISLRCTFAFYDITIENLLLSFTASNVYYYAIANEFFLLQKMKTKIFINPFVATKILIS